MKFNWGVDKFWSGFKLVRIYNSLDSYQIEVKDKQGMKFMLADYSSWKTTDLIRIVQREGF